MKKIGIFGGSFDPIHKAHSFIANEAIKLLNLDILYFVPTYINPDKKNKKIASPKDRVNMINLVKNEKSKISLFEINRKNISYTIDTINYFKNKFKDDDIYFIIGSDNINKIHKWEGIDSISKNAKIIVFKREKNINKLNIKKYNATLLNNEIIESSSTNYKKGFINLVDKKIQEYIGKNLLYGNDIAISTLDVKRYKHSVATSIMAEKIAKKLSYNRKIAKFAGLMHDITKNWTEEEHRKYLVINNYENNEKIPNHKLHQLTAALWLKNEFFVENKEIIKAISTHTTLDFDLTLLNKIIFIADKICQGRKFEGIQKLRNLAFSNFDEAFKQVVKKIWDFNLAKGVKLSDEQLQIYKKWSK